MSKILTLLTFNDTEKTHQLEYIITSRNHLAELIHSKKLYFAHSISTEIDVFKRARRPGFHNEPFISHSLAHSTKEERLYGCQKLSDSGVFDSRL